MTYFDKLKSMSIDELTEWMDEYCVFDNAPWLKLFENKYCSNCESVFLKERSDAEKLGLDLGTECSYCEVENKCRYFPDKQNPPDNVDMIKMWLTESIE